MLAAPDLAVVGVARPDIAGVLELLGWLPKALLRMFSSLMRQRFSAPQDSKQSRRAGHAASSSSIIACLALTDCAFH